jgi:glyoxylase-like metal-dependent hydrolase (beta-lactamase superfamily II)
MKHDYQLETLPVGPFEVNCFLLSNATGEALVVDPGDDVERILEHLEKRHLTVAAYLMTHGHADHVSGLSEMVQARPAPIAMHPKDVEWAFSDRNQLPPFYPSPPKRPSKIEHLITDGQELVLAGFAVRVLSTPGHSPGSVCFHLPALKILFSGDTLFAGSVGRTDFPGGSSRTLAQSLLKLAGLPGATRVYPGHGPDTTLDEEKRTNYFMQNAGGNIPE